jgi:hypothetical protein
LIQFFVLHYKQRCPNLRYIEVSNEPTAKNQINLGKIERYYGFYRRAYEAINEVNAELRLSANLEPMALCLWTVARSHE